MNIIAQVAGQLEVVFERTQCLGVDKMLYDPKLFFRGGKAQRVNLLAQKPNIGVVKEGLGWLDGNVILEEDLEEDAQFF